MSTDPEDDPTPPPMPGYTYPSTPPPTQTYTPPPTYGYPPPYYGYPPPWYVYPPPYSDKPPEPSIPIAAGIMLLIGGILCIIGGLYNLIWASFSSSFWSILTDSQDVWWYQLRAILGFIVGACGITGGAFGMVRKRWMIALSCAILMVALGWGTSLVLGLIFGIIGLILVIVSKKDFIN
jgi:hypothetical protein